MGSLVSEMNGWAATKTDGWVSTSVICDSVSQQQMIFDGHLTGLVAVSKKCWLRGHCLLARTETQKVNK